MANFGFQTIRDNVVGSVRRMTGPQRITLGLAFVATVAGMWAVFHLTSGTPMSVLYANLDAKAAADVVAQLDTQGVPYELSDNGQTIKVPSAKVADVRLKLSAQGLPASGEGWSILDKQGITTSEFDQRVGYQRAMEGELAKTIRAIDGVSDASVHLVIPRSDLFTTDSVQPSASVLVVTKSGQSLAPTQVQAIVNLVSSSVEGMKAEQVSVTDQAGHVLAAPGDTAGAVGLAGDTQLRATREYQATMEKDLETLLDTVVGPGMAKVNVTAALDFDAVKSTTEAYEPAKTADGSQSLLKETSRTERYRDAGSSAESGVLGIETPTTAATGTTSTTAAGTGGSTTTSASGDANLKYSLDERDANYAMNKTVTNAEQAPGRVKQLSVAVLLDESTLDPAKVAEVEKLVSAAAGLNTTRGDTLAVSLLPMNEQVKSSITSANTPADAGSGFDILGLVRTAGTVLVALVVVVLGVLYLRKGSAGNRQVIDSLSMSELEGALPALGAGGRAGAAADEDDDGELAVPAEVRLQTLIANQPEEVAGVLRSWLGENASEPVPS